MASETPEVTSTQESAKPPIPAPPATPYNGDNLPVPTGGARQVSEETDSFLFEYEYPQEAGEIEKLAAWLDGQLDETRDQLAKEAVRGREQARANGFPYNKYSFTTNWRVDADLPAWLSMTANYSDYSGGAHPNYGFETLVWSKQEGEPIEPIAFFTSADSLNNALSDQLCEALNKEREKRRGQPVPADSDDQYDKCIKAEDVNLMLVSKGGEKFDSIGVLIAPYLAGPYAEGDYEFDFPITPELLDAVKPQYREAFAAKQ